MKKRILGALLAALFFCGEASAVSYSSITTEATAVSVTSDGAAGYDDENGTTTDSLTASASSIGSTDVATAGAFYGDGLLTTSADVSALGIGSSTATTSFTGSFVNTGAVSLGLDFTFENDVTGAGIATTNLFVSVVSGGVTLFSDYVTGPWTFNYTPVAGTTSFFGLILTSDVSSGFVTSGSGNASSVGLVSFSAAAVPEAPVWLLLSLGAGLLVASRRIGRREAMPA